jgi:hypothetical protein
MLLALLTELNPQQLDYLLRIFEGTQRKQVRKSFQLGNFEI